MPAELHKMKHVEIFLVCLPEVIGEMLVFELELHDDCLDDLAGFVDNRKGVARRFARFELLL